MKKYQQLLLVILSVFSFVSLLFYRHEYNKLRYVLEVFNIFGTPGVTTSPPASCSQNVSAERYLLSEPLPAWQRISNTLYVYSAYWEYVSRKVRVMAPAIGVLNENLNYGCYIWYDFYPDPVKSQFRFSGLSRRSGDSVGRTRIGAKYAANKTSQIKGYMFYCDGNEENVVPVGVTFYKMSKDQTSQAFIPLYRIKSDPPVANSTAVCVLPNEALYMKKRNYLEFLSFHRNLGLRDFIVYGGNNQYNVIGPLLKNATFDIALVVLQWNYPFFGDFDLMMSVAENDCIIRARGLFENVLVLKWNQYFVPRTHSSAQTVISRLDTKKQGVSAFQLHPLIFCLEYKDDPKTNIYMPLIFRKTRFSTLKNIDDTSFVFKTDRKNGTAQKIGRDVVAVHWYVKCDSFDLRLLDKRKERIDESMQMFRSEIMQSKLMRLE